MEDEHRKKNGSATPEERFQELQRESAEWSERVEKSVRKLDRVTKAPKVQKTSAQRGGATPAPPNASSRAF